MRRCKRREGSPSTTASLGSLHVKKLAHVSWVVRCHRLSVASVRALSVIQHRPLIRVFPVNVNLNVELNPPWEAVRWPCLWPVFMLLAAAGAQRPQSLTH